MSIDIYPFFHATGFVVHLPSIPPFGYLSEFLIVHTIVHKYFKMLSSIILSNFQQHMFSISILGQDICFVTPDIFRVPSKSALFSYPSTPFTQRDRYRDFFADLSGWESNRFFHKIF